MPVGEVYAASRQSSGAQYPLPMPSDRGEQLRMLRDRFAARQTRCEPILLKDAKPSIGLTCTAGRQRHTADKGSGRGTSSGVAGVPAVAPEAEEEAG